MTEWVSRTPGKAIEPTSSRMRWMCVLPVMAPENDEITVAGYGQGQIPNVPNSASDAGLGVARPPLEPPIGSASYLDIRLACRIDQAVSREVPDVWT
jgi:hypothetical protein